MALGPFIVMTTFGCAIWAVVFALLGMLAGSGWAELSGPVGDLTLGVCALVAIAVLLAQRLRGR